ncbi:MAG TPA: anti-sigma factor [Solirubrobacteraceae bacterium]|nr:anti-sigma factor [Solirubrobacteraceae bacterium]
MSESNECRSDAAAYVLGSLEQGEAEAFRRHLASCVVCRDEVAAFQQAVDLLPMAAPQYPLPRGLRRRVLRELRAERRATPPDVGRRRPAPSLFGMEIRRPALVLGVLLFAALATVGALELASSGSSGVRIIQASVTGSAGHAELRLSGGRAELIVSRLPPPPLGHVYEVWLTHGRRPPSPTNVLFSVTSTGSGDVGVPGDLRGVSEILVTPEPIGGSRAPTHTPVIVARLA